MSEIPDASTSNPPSAHTNPFPRNPVESEASSNAIKEIPVFPSQNLAPLQKLAQANFIRPRARLERRDLMVDPGTRRVESVSATRYAMFCHHLFEYLEAQNELSGGDNSSNLTEDSFVKICQTILVFRVQQVREHRIGQRAVANRIALSRTLLVPAALSEVLSGIGEIYLEHDGYSFVPTLPPISSPPPDYYTVDAINLRAFIQFVDVLHRRNLHRAAPLPSSYEGTPFWTLQRRYTGSAVTVTGHTAEGTPADGLLRAIIDIGDGAQEYQGFTYVDSIDPESLRQSYFSMN